MMNRQRSRSRSASRRRGPRGGDLKTRIVEAAIEVLKTRGFTGTSARAIADQGGFNSALIFYYFGTLNAVLLAALDHSAEQRIARYREAIDRVQTLEELAAVAAEIYREDVEGGHITLFSELVGACLSHPELAPEIVARTQPWLDLVEETVARVIAGSPLEEIVPTRDVAYAVVAFYMGLNLLTHMDADRSRVDALFNLARALGPFVTPFLESGKD